MDQQNARLAQQNKEGQSSLSETIGGDRDKDFAAKATRRSSSEKNGGKRVTFSGENYIDYYSSYQQSSERQNQGFQPINEQQNISSNPIIPGSNNNRSQTDYRLRMNDPSQIVRNIVEMAVGNMQQMPANTREVQNTAYIQPQQFTKADFPTTFYNFNDNRSNRNNNTNSSYPIAGADTNSSVTAIANNGNGNNNSNKYNRVKSAQYVNNEEKFADITGSFHYDEHKEFLYRETITKLTKKNAELIAKVSGYEKIIATTQEIAEEARLTKESTEKLYNDFVSLKGQFSTLFDEKKALEEKLSERDDTIGALKQTVHKLEKKVKNLKHDNTLLIEKGQALESGTKETIRDMSSKFQQTLEDQQNEFIKKVTDIDSSSKELEQKLKEITFEREKYKLKVLENEKQTILLKQKCSELVKDMSEKINQLNDELYWYKERFSVNTGAIISDTNIKTNNNNDTMKVQTSNNTPGYGPGVNSKTDSNDNNINNNGHYEQANMVNRIKLEEEKRKNELALKNFLESSQKLLSSDNDTKTGAEINKKTNDSISGSYESQNQKQGIEKNTEKKNESQTRQKHISFSIENGIMNANPINESQSSFTTIKDSGASFAASMSELKSIGPEVDVRKYSMMSENSGIARSANTTGVLDSLQNIQQFGSDKSYSQTEEKKNSKQGLSQDLSLSTTVSSVGASAISGFISSELKNSNIGSLSDANTANNDEDSKRNENSVKVDNTNSNVSDSKNNNDITNDTSNISSLTRDQQRRLTNQILGDVDINSLISSSDDPLLALLNEKVRNSNSSSPLIGRGDDLVAKFQRKAQHLSDLLRSSNIEIPSSLAKASEM